ncbi:MAG: hypothetical protein EYC68_16940 [Chloroflexota bacterium]|nr:MAG: hypothetical protein EYC68_16940 [Chloroflexota bacterium]
MKWHVFRTISLLSLTLCLAIVACSRFAATDGLVNESDYNVNFRLRLHVDRDRLRANEPVTATLSLTNIGKQAQAIESQGTPVLNLYIEDIVSHENYATWSVEHPDLVTHRLQLQPGESKTIQLTWILEPEDAFSGKTVSINGLLYERSTPVKGLDVLLCVNSC